MLWLTILVLVISLIAAGTAYLVCAVSRFRWVQRISGGKKWFGRSLAFLLILVVFVLSAAVLSVMDAVVILLHTEIFFLIYGLVLRILGRPRNKEKRISLQGWLALMTSVVYLAAGFYLCVHVWQTKYPLSTDKGIRSVRIALLSDSHVGTTFDGEGFGKHLEMIMQQEPDLILIPGDFVDDGTTRTDMLSACSALGRVAPRFGIWFAYGNHDKGYYNGRDFSAEELEQALEANHVHVLEDETALIANLCIVGRRDASAGSRAELKDLLAGVDPGRYIIVMDHEPTDFENESATAADLVVCGHTHGGQLIPLGLIGRWFGGNDRTYGYEQRGETDFIVTSGIADWAMHFKTGTRSEYVIITIN